MADEERPRFTLSAKTPEERGITFSVREAPSTRGSTDPKIARALVEKPKVLLGPWESTAICGNDITSSCLYVAALAAGYAGVYAPFALLGVAGLLYLYRKIYAEVGDALPLNGGTYNCLLNTTTKARASIAACMTVLSYIATAVISAKTSVDYVIGALGANEAWIIPLTIAILAIFAGLVIIGIGESAKTALAIFIFHLTSLGILIISGLIYILMNPTILQHNWEMQFPTPQSSFFLAIFFGFCVSLLGVSGFESSANFIEEQKPGVFPITLRNMWIAVSILNPVIALVALGALPLDVMVQNEDAMLLNVAEVTVGKALRYIIAADAAFVLCGAVLASYVGVTGLVTRMTLDRCLPQFLLRINSRGTYYLIILLFFALCTSILVTTGGDKHTLAGVYTISFLGVMCLFAVGNILLKIRRNKLPRRYRASWLTLFIAIIVTLIGIYGNMRLNGSYVYYFSIYFFPTVAIVLLTLYRHNILGFILLVAEETMKSIELSHQRIRDKIKRRIAQMYSQGVIFFTKGDDVASLNKALLYVQENEVTRKITVVHVLDGTEEPPPRLVSDLRLLDEIYPDIQIELVVRKGKFGPELIRQLSEEYGIAPNYMFVGTPGDHFPHQISELGGVRVII